MQPPSLRVCVDLGILLCTALAGASADLKIDVTQSTDCERKTKVGDTVAMHYKGMLEDGTVFDTSYGRPAPFTFTLGAGQVIDGWDQGLLDMCVGDERKLTIPPEMAYGDRPMGKIPAGSVLIFETKLAGLTLPDGTEITAPSPSDAEPTPAATATPTPVPDTSSAAGAEDGECRLLGPFALFVQGGLGLLAVTSLVWKRYRERPRRPLLIWFFDASKQVFGSVLLHVANLIMSILPAEYALNQASLVHASMPNTAGEASPNPCSFYLINLAIDTTVGIVILVVILRLLQHVFLLTPVARPAESIRSGNYGQPPRVTWWLKQTFIYFLALLLMKLCVFGIFQILPWIAWVGDWALRWTEGSEAVQITFVMFIFPLIMNGLQYYIIDTYIKDPGHGQIAVSGDDDDADDEARDPLNAGEGFEPDGAGTSASSSAKWSERIRTKEVASPTTAEFTEDGVEIGRQSASSTPHASPDSRS